MPLLQDSSFKRPKWLFNGHLETIYPALARRVNFQSPRNERITTPDGDFLDLDWYCNGNHRLTIISHGLEGSSSRPYMLGMTKKFVQNGFDVLAWNYRGCSGELNDKPIFYHSGATYDLETVVDHAEKKYDEIFLVGFSLGGNLTLKYLGEKRSRSPKIKKGVAVSVPLDLGKSCDKISTRENFLYSKRFLKSLKEKVIRKSEKFPQQIDFRALNHVKTLRDFDNFFTGPLHGFKDAEEYYQVNSSLFFLEGIQVPTLVLNALNDPFLSQSCFPKDLAEKLDQVYFEFPSHGGHVGFSSALFENTYYSEGRAVEFITHDL
ncbi:YheT family hydrolase [Algoriphagus mannitolivorans]|uniref:YheT family hydrolase n=1 Tax=Algoriphagus mannitolivorans TaxID=226504 RepID=UPI000411BA22|nr:alpha/beta fold hydrolase [Algoriphagus mannitolivorans]